MNAIKFCKFQLDRMPLWEYRVFQKLLLYISRQNSHITRICIMQKIFILITKNGHYTVCSNMLLVWKRSRTIQKVQSLQFTLGYSNRKFHTKSLRPSGDQEVYCKLAKLHSVDKVQINVWLRSRGTRKGSHFHGDNYFIWPQFLISTLMLE
jgi:hypothetical protein